MHSEKDTEMSPDPPREVSQEDTDTMEGAVYFMAMSDEDDDFMGDENQVHELDYSSHEDTDFSDAEDGTERTTGTATSTGGSARSRNNVENSATDADNSEGSHRNSRMMAHYQLLIPFPQPENTSSSSDFELENGTRYEMQQHPRIITTRVASAAAVIAPTTTTTTTTTATDTENSSGSPVAVTVVDGPDSETKDEMKDAKEMGEINLTEDKVEIIKNAMKGFTLPPSSIPNWAEEIDETSWKERLSNSIQRKTTSPTTITTPSIPPSNKAVH